MWRTAFLSSSNLCCVRNKIIYVLSWRTVYGLIRLLLWCLLPSLFRNSGNKHGDFSPFWNYWSVLIFSSEKTLTMRCIWVVGWLHGMTPGRGVGDGSLYTVKPVYNDHLMGYFSAFWSSSRWPRARHNNCGGWTTATSPSTEKHVAPPFNKYTDLLHSNQDKY